MGVNVRLSFGSKHACTSTFVFVLCLCCFVVWVGALRRILETSALLELTSRPIGYRGYVILEQSSRSGTSHGSMHLSSKKNH